MSNLDLSKSVDLGLAAPLTVAVGAEYKWNSFQLSSGEYSAYYGLGSQGTSGFSPSQAGTWSRNNWSLYASLEQKIVNGLEVALAGRHESYSDFGDTNTGKASIRIEPVHGLAFRGTVSTGFRAPSLQQQHYGGSGTNTVTINGVNQLAPTLTVPVDNAAAIALGASSLKPEESTSYSAGIVVTPTSRLNITYQIKVRNRILLSDTLQGGTAADAIIATMAVMNVVEPWASSIGGNGFATCLDRKTGKVHALAFTGGAPRLTDPSVDPAELDHGPKSLAVPGAFGGWIELARRFGTLPLATLLEPAIGYARDGYPLDPSIALFITRMQKTLSLYPTSAALFLPGGKPPAPRSIFRNPGLARILQALVDAETKALKGGADRGRALQAAYDYFYTGPVAQEFERFSIQTGGWLRADDLKAYRPRWSDPVTTNYRGLDVYSSPLTSRTGLEMCQMLNLVEGFDLASLPADGPQLPHLLIEAIKVAKADVYKYAADPAFSSVPFTGLLSKAFAAQRRQLINPLKAGPYPEGGNAAAFAQAMREPARLSYTAHGDERSRGGDTTSMSAVDAQGNAVAVTVTVGGGFGTCLVMGETGVLFNNGLRVGSTAPYADHPNSLAPHKIALLGNGPTIVLDKGRLRMVFGSPGGETIGQTQFQFLVDVVDRGMPIQAAIEAPRFALDADPSFYRPGAAITVQAESRFGAPLLQQLTSMGHRVEKVGPYSIGSVQGILVDASGARMAGADPRRMGYAMGY